MEQVTFLSTLLLSAFFNNLAVSSPLDTCSVKVEPIGCFRDESNDRALTELVTKTSESMVTPSDKKTDWENWSDLLPQFICKCAQMAFSKGYKVIGLQAFGECYSSLHGHLVYDKHGKSNTCIGSSKYSPWSTCRSIETACCGEALSNFVYRIAPTVCEHYYEPAGCFADQSGPPRPLPELAITERDYSSSKWNGHLIDWRQWNKYSPEMICRCATKARKMGKKVFGIQFYGECWTGDDTSKYAKDGPSMRCLGKDYKPCAYHSYHCVGRDHANSVYILKADPLAPSNKTDTGNVAE